MRFHFPKKKLRGKKSSFVSSEISAKKAEINELKNFMKELSKENRRVNRNAKTLKTSISIDSLKAKKKMTELKGDLHELRKEKVINFFRVFKPAKRVTKKAKEKYTY